MSNEIGTLDAVSFRSADGRFGVTLPSHVLRRLIEHAQHARNIETGGVLVGHYNERLNHGSVTEVIGPPPDSRAWQTGFLRGVGGLARRLLALWQASTRSYYLGEWHFHPYATPSASADDERQMLTIADDPRYHCPEPILLIMGGDPSGAWTMAAYVFTRSGGRLRLHRALEREGNVNPHD